MTKTDLDIVIAADPKVKIINVGREQEPVIIVDDFLTQPGMIMGFAGDGSDFKAEKGDFYPGVRKPLPNEYAEGICAFIQAHVVSYFGFDARLEPQTVLSALSMVTHAPEALIPIQRIPHFDTPDANQLGVVQYFHGSELGGTSFYRHRDTGFETITNERHNIYRRTLEREATTVGLPKPAYMAGDSALFERTAQVEARFNRIIFYRSNLLHAGDIDPNMGLSSNPEQGRLTATSFIRMVQPS